VDSDALPTFEAECFLIAPIGSEDSEIRDRSDGVMQYIVAPAAKEVGLTVVRADKIAKPGEINRQVIEHVLGAKAAVVDLTGTNPNVYYEMAIRHTAQLPTVLIAQEGEKLPFDIAQMRTIFFDHRSLKSAADCTASIVRHLQEALAGEVDSPVTASVSLQRLEQQGSPESRVLAQVLDGLDEVRTLLRRGEGRKSSGATRAASDRLDDIYRWLGETDDVDRELLNLLDRLADPLDYMLEGHPSAALRHRRSLRRRLLANDGDDNLVRHTKSAVAEVRAEIEEEIRRDVSDELLRDEGSDEAETDSPSE